MLRPAVALMVLALLSTACDTGPGVRADRIEVGGIRQVRVQDGGVHERGQNHARLHFGLAKNTRIDKLVVHWPSGAVQELKEIAADDWVAG